MALVVTVVTGIVIPIPAKPPPPIPYIYTCQLKDINRAQNMEQAETFKETFDNTQDDIKAGFEPLYAFMPFTTVFTGFRGKDEDSRSAHSSPRNRGQ